MVEQLKFNNLRSLAFLKRRFVIFLDVALYGAISHPLPNQMVHNDTGASFFNPALSIGVNAPLLPK